MKAPFTSIDLFRREFYKGLHGLAEQGALGTFILASANALTHEDLLNDLSSTLAAQYEDLYKTYREAFLTGHYLDVVDEDLLVFLKLHAIGFDAIRPTETREEGPWRVQFNHLRSFRPRRITQFVHAGMMQPYDEDDFNFNKPFMAKECFWRGELLGRRVDLFYNKYPFADLHGLLVLDRERCLPQLLGQLEHQYIFGLTEALEATMPGAGFGYNSYGAYASVNHMHFQMFVDTRGLPVMDSKWKHNGGDEMYPAECHAFFCADTSWKFIQQLHHQQQPYNILYHSGRIYVFPRKTQGTVAVPDWSSGFTWYELSGGIITFNHQDYTQLKAETIAEYLGQLRTSA
ncbi:MAG: hypothetical protein EP315_08120 [Gammaproteobacteria bacterium]|nr:MAG: hypothetical protein EP315_08120 [Gammaproteobacteria bacterium]